MEYESDQIYSFLIEEKDADGRLDIFLSSRTQELTRSRIQELIKAGLVEVNDHASKASYRLKFGDQICVRVPPARPTRLEPEPIDFGIIYEDSSLLVLNKPPGLVVHPAPGHYSGTLVHGLLKHCGDLSGIGGVLRPGIVHRLDKDTSGLIVVAKNDRVHHWLSGQFATRHVTKKYTALIHGAPKEANGRIESFIGRHPRRRKEMSVVTSGGKKALTFWKSIRTFGTCYSLLAVSPKTGRTHQIRVHLAHVGHPIVGDTVYGRKQERRTRTVCQEQGRIVRPVRHMLHAGMLGFVHPDSGKYLEFRAPLPADMQDMVSILGNVFDVSVSGVDGLS